MASPCAHSVKSSSLSFVFKNMSLMRVVAKDMELLCGFGVRVRNVLCSVRSSVLLFSLEAAKLREWPGACLCAACRCAEDMNSVAGNWGAVYGMANGDLLKEILAADLVEICRLDTLLKSSLIFVIKINDRYACAQ
jgi:hypothetical protein